MAIYGGFSHKKWWFSIAILVHQRIGDISIVHGVYKPILFGGLEHDWIMTFQKQLGMEWNNHPNWLSLHHFSEG